MIIGLLMRLLRSMGAPVPSRLRPTLVDRALDERAARRAPGRGPRRP